VGGANGKNRALKVRVTLGGTNGLERSKREIILGRGVSYCKRVKLGKGGDFKGASINRKTSRNPREKGAKGTPFFDARHLDKGSKCQTGAHLSVYNKKEKVRKKRGSPRAGASGKTGKVSAANDRGGFDRLSNCGKKKKWEGEKAFLLASEEKGCGRTRSVLPSTWSQFWSWISVR